jgi:hypothetical protein
MNAALRALVSAANKGGGEDNITVVAFEIVEQALASDGDTREQARPEEEDTLSELDAVAAVDTGVVPVEEIRAQVADEEARERKVRRRHLRRRLVAWIVLLVILAAIGVALYLRFVR